jgi:AraC-like DNA-binding protein
VHRLPPGPGCEELVRIHWVPVWSIPEGETWEQRVLQHPCCNLVVGPDYARLYGVVPGLSTVTLQGDGWVFGTLLQPGTGFLLAGRPIVELAGRHLDVTDWHDLVEPVRALMAPDPGSAAVRERTRALVETWLLDRVPRPDEEGRLVNAIADYVESTPEVQRVAQICERFALGERRLQRLLAKRLGLTPKWLIQRRRLHDAVAGLGVGTRSLAGLAADLGYTDQAHFTHDFREATGLPPGAFAELPP